MKSRFEMLADRVKSGRSEIFKNWSDACGITEEDFIDGLSWLSDDPMPDDRPSRELGCDRKRGLVKLRRDYWPLGPVYFYEVESGRQWSGKPSINFRDNI